MNVLITGASGGIGRELVRQYLAAGDTVIAAVLHPAPELAEFAGGHLIPLLLDVTSPASIKSAAEQVLKQVDHLDILFNNAGIVGSHTDFEHFESDAFLETFQVNTLAPILLCRAFLPLLQKSTHARVLTLTSRTGALFAGSTTPDSSYGYCSSKAALHRLLPLLAADLEKSGITSVGIDPGFVETNMTRSYSGDRIRLTPELSVAGLRQTAAALTPEYAGALLRWNGSVCKWFAPPESEKDLQLIPPSFPDPFSLASLPP